MPRFLVLKLDGPMQAWGGHTFEDFRPSHDFPTRSGLLGLLAACLGIERDDGLGQARLAASVEFTVRADDATSRPERDEEIVKRRAIKLADYHTVMDARRVNRAPKEGETIQSWREYLHDASFTVAVAQREAGGLDLDEIANALAWPVYTPSLGRRSCPPARPLIHGDKKKDFVEASDGVAALKQVPPSLGLVYSETLGSDKPFSIRDVPMHRDKRQFATRKIYVHVGREVADVHQPG